MSTKTRFEKEAKGNSEMVYYMGWITTDINGRNLLGYLICCFPRIRKLTDRFL